MFLFLTTLRFTISSVAPTRSSIFYAYFITKIGNRNLKTSNINPVEILTGECPLSKPVITFEREQFIVIMLMIEFKKKLQCIIRSFNRLSGHTKT